jgi:hypothetical protein
MLHILHGYAEEEVGNNSIGRSDCNRTGLEVNRPETLLLARAGYEVDSEHGSDPERPWRLIQGLRGRDLRIVVVARRVGPKNELGTQVLSVER